MNTPHPVPVKTVINAGPVWRAGEVADITTKITPMPQMRGTLQGWTRRMVVQVAQTRILEDGTAEHRLFPTNTAGVMQPSDFETLDMQTGGDRSWNYWWLHCDSNLNLQTNDLVIIGGVWFRVLRRKNYEINGFIEYRLTEALKPDGF